MIESIVNTFGSVSMLLESGHHSIMTILRSVQARGSLFEFGAILPPLDSSEKRLLNSNRASLILPSFSMVKNALNLNLNGGEW